MDNTLIKNGRSYVGRYLLHVYENNHDAHVGKTRRHRAWLTDLLTPGRRSIARFSVESQIQTIRNVVGTGLANLELEATVTNFVLGPLSVGPAERSVYVCVLTRIDAFTVFLNGDSWSVNEDRQQTEAPAGQGFTTIRDAVGRLISIRDEAEAQAPIPDEVPPIDEPEDAEPAEG